MNDRNNKSSIETEHYYHNYGNSEDKDTKIKRNELETRNRAQTKEKALVTDVFKGFVTEYTSNWIYSWFPKSFCP